MKHENELWPQDEALFASMRHTYRTPAERLFFETMHSKMLDENAPWPETLVWEQDNNDHIYLLRHGYDEFMLGRGLSRDEWQGNEIHTMNLSDALSTNLKGARLLDKDITLLKWLQDNNFKFVRYNHVNDGNIV